MASTETNKFLYDSKYSWADGGEEWSVAWGNSEMQWYGMLLPRLHCFLPRHRILEIGPGYGRWTKFLLNSCDELIGVDISEKAVTACKDRFGSQKNCRFMVGSGESLSAVESRSIDLVFSFDSLVHVESPEMMKYLGEIERVLTPTGVAFLHHSNLASYPIFSRASRGLPELIRRGLAKFMFVDFDHLRASTVSAPMIRKTASSQGLKCVGQELFNWGTRRLIDCISILSLPSAKYPSITNPILNPFLMKNAEALRIICSLYSNSTDDQGNPSLRVL